MGSGRDLVGVLRVKAAGEALQQSNSLQGCGESILIPFVYFVFWNDLLDHLGGFLLNGFDICV